MVVLPTAREDKARAPADGAEPPTAALGPTLAAAAGSGAARAEGLGDTLDAAAGARDDLAGVGSEDAATAALER